MYELSSKEIQLNSVSIHWEEGKPKDNIVMLLLSTLIEPFVSCIFMFTMNLDKLVDEFFTHKNILHWY